MSKLFKKLLGPLVFLLVLLLVGQIQHIPYLLPLVIFLLVVLITGVVILFLLLLTEGVAPHLALLVLIALVAVTIICVVVVPVFWYILKPLMMHCVATIFFGVTSEFFRSYSDN